MYIVTGGAGFIGSHLVENINAGGVSDIIVVDSIGKDDEKYKNLCDLSIADYYDKDEFSLMLSNGKLPCNIKAVFHQGACTDTMETDGRFMLENNFTFSKKILEYTLKNKIPLVYASSASTYGCGKNFSERAEYEQPLNVYGYSKLLFDQYVRKLLPAAESTVIGLRYFNVYGSRETYKGRMASMVYQLYRQLKTTGKAKLFEGSGGYGNGEQCRDFISVSDVVKINMFFAGGKVKKGIVNCGTGKSRTFNDIAQTIISIIGSGKIEYIEMPENIKSKYQSFTEADLSNLRGLGYTQEFASLEEGVKQCVEYWNR